MTARIGLEIHCQLTNLQSKLFCPCKADYRGMGANENVCPVCMGLPGSLPRLNREAVRKAMLIAMALNCATPDRIAFFRKHYFYPDLPKNFQITQLNAYGDTSIGGAGHVAVEGDHEVRITRIQLEEDPGRLVYEKGPSKTMIPLVDYNRAGTALVEVVTEPDFESPQQVRRFLNIFSDLLENLEVSDPGLEGAMRADANVSVEGGSKVEIKNIGSFYDLEKAVRFEITRQQSLHSRGMPIAQETRHWDERRKITTTSRAKAGEPDYRYFLEGDVPWVGIDPATRSELREEMPESVASKRERYVSEHGLPAQVAEVLSADKFHSDLFEEACAGEGERHAREIANIITTDLMGLAGTREGRESSGVSAGDLRDLASAIGSGRISRTSARGALAEMVRTGNGLRAVMAGLDLGRVSDEGELAGIVSKVISEEPQAAEQARTNPQTINFLVGKVMRKTGGRADPKVTLDLLKRELGGAG